MAVISTFDQWQKDVFFSAAEEVQESADTMESVYRMWVRERSDGLEPEFLDELRRELYRTLGTTKWQLEEFEKAVSLSHGNYSLENNVITRHRAFIAAIQNKISHVERAISDSLVQEGKQPLRWVQIDEEEADEFESFLSLTPKSLQKTVDKYIDHGFKQAVTKGNDTKYLLHASAKEASLNNHEVAVQEDCVSEQKRREDSLDIDSCKIVIFEDDDEGRRPVEASSRFSFLRGAGLVSRLRWFRTSFSKPKSDEHLQSRFGFSNYLDLRGVTWLAQGSRSCFSSFKEGPKSCRAQQIGRVGGNRRSIQVTLLLVITVFLIVPFLFYSS